MSNQNNHTDTQNHTYREDIVDTLGGAINVALQKEYERGWDDCMKYFWEKREKEDVKK